MAKLVDVWIFDWDKYSPDDLVQKCDSFQPGPALLAALVKSSRATTCGARARSAAIRINPTTPRVMAASRSANAVPVNVRFGSEADISEMSLQLFCRWILSARIRIGAVGAICDRCH
jgi:hypothetical protein